MWSFKKGIKHILNIPDATEGLLFNIDSAPLLEDPERTAVKGWALDPKGAPVHLELRISQRRIAEYRCQVCRADVNAYYPENRFSVLSGFIVPFDMQVLARIPGGRLELVAISSWGETLLWRWEGTQGVRIEDTYLKDAPVLRELKQQLDENPFASEAEQFWLTDDEVEAFFRDRNTYSFIPPVDYGAKDAPEKLILDVAVKLADGQYSHGLETWLGGVPGDSTRWGTIVAIADDAEAATGAAAVLSRTVGAKHHAGSTRENFPGWRSVLGNDDPRAHLVLVVDGDVDPGLIDLSSLLSDFLSYPNLHVLMGTPYGGREGLPGPAGKSLPALRENPNPPLLYLTKKRSPVYLTSAAFLTALEPRSDSKQPLGLFEPPVDDAFFYHLDLQQPVLAGASNAYRAGKDEAFLIGQMVRARYPFQLSTGAGETVFIVLPEDVDSLAADVIEQVVALADAISEAGYPVHFVQDADAEPKMLGTHTPVRLADLPTGVRLSGWAVAIGVEAVRAAFALKYLYGVRVAQFLQELELPKFRARAPEKVRLAEWAYRSEAVQIVNSTGIEAALREENGGERARIRVPFVLQSEAPATDRAGLFVELSGRLITAERLSGLRDALESLRRRFPNLRIVLHGCESAGAASLSPEARAAWNECLSLATLRLNSCAPTERELLRASCETVLDLFPSFAVNGTAMRTVRSEQGLLLAYNAGVADDAETAGSVLLLREDAFSSWASIIAEHIVDEQGRTRSDERQAPFRTAASRLDGRKLLQELDRAYESYQQSIGASRSERRPVAVLIPVFNALDSVALCARSVQRHLPENHQVLFVNDASDAGTTEWLREFCESDDRFRVLELERNRGFVGACLAGFAEIDPDADLLLVNSDVVVTEGAFEKVADAVYSRPDIGAASPLSTGSPHLELPLNPGQSIDEAASVVDAHYQAIYPTVITPEGQFLYLRREALSRLGFFDPVYGRGFFEESDLCLRLLLHGFDTVCADNALIYHRRAASFGAEGKSQQLTKNRPVFTTRWGRYWSKIYNEFRARDVLAEVRRTYRSFAVPLTRPEFHFELRPDLEHYRHLSSSDRRPARKPVLGDAEVVFILSQILPGGGALSVLQHANEMIQRGVNVKIVALFETRASDFPLLTDRLLVTPEELFELDWSDQHVVATYWFTSYLVKGLTLRYPGLKGYYYVQDYEPWFYPRPERFLTVQQAERSYEQGLQCVVKTPFLRQLLQERHGLKATLIAPGLHREVFYPGQQDQYTGAIRIAALFRAATPRRGGKELLSALRMVKQRLPEAHVRLFGDSEGLPEDLQGQIELVGTLSQAQVGSLYRDTDIVVDLSHWQGFGRMGIEGMASGAVPVLSSSGGVERYARDGENGLIVPVGDPGAAADAIVRLAVDHELRMRLREQGIESLREFSEERATEDWLKVMSADESKIVYFQNRRDREAQSFL